jgi:hypothetical protein
MKTTQLPPAPAPPTPPTADVIAAGLPVSPIDRLRIMSPRAWTDFVLEWADSLKTKYALVERCDGAGDMGRDVIGFEKLDAGDPWDNYQCKHYDHQLTPGDIWLELGKLIYYTHIGEFSVPRRYFFVAPQGAGPKLSSLLRSATKLRAGLLENWEQKCRHEITSKRDIPLDDQLKAHIGAIDFSIFSAPSPLTIIEEHSRTRHYAARFGGGLRARPPTPAPPTTIAANEANYIRALLDAYEDRLKAILQSPDQITDTALAQHFKRARLEFYSAEALKGFSRDTVPLGTFEVLLDEVFNGIADVLQSAHSDAYARVLATVGHAKTLPLSASPLFARISSPDKGGMCHQLANEKLIKWKS